MQFLMLFSDFSLSRGFTAMLLVHVMKLFLKFDVNDLREGKNFDQLLYAT